MAYLIGDTFKKEYNEDGTYKIVQERTGIFQKVVSEDNQGYIDFINSGGIPEEIPLVPVPVDIEILRTQKVEEIKKECNAEILAGFYSDAKGGTSILYGLDYEDQINMEALKNNIALGLIAEGSLTYYAKSEPCEPWTNAEFMQLYSDAMAFKTERITTAKTLISQAKIATEEELELMQWTLYGNVSSI